MKKKSGNPLRNRRIQTILLMIFDFLAIMLSYFFALRFRFDCHFSAIPLYYTEPYALFCPIYAAVCVLVFYCFRLYRMIRSFVSYSEVMRILTVSGVMSVMHIICITVFVHRMPISYYLIGLCLQAMFVTGIRVSYRLFLLMTARRNEPADTGRVMLIGAGSAEKERFYITGEGSGMKIKKLRSPQKKFLKDKK